MDRLQRQTDGPQRGAGVLSRVIVSLAYAVAGLGALFMVAHTGPVTLEIERVIATDNALLVFASMAAVAAVVSTLYMRLGWDWTRASPVDISLMGIALEAAGWILHRSYWFIWRTLRDLDYYGHAEWMAEGPALIVTGVAIVAVVIGAILIVNPFSRGVFGRRWFVASLVVAAALWAVTYQALTLLHDVAAIGL